MTFRILKSSSRFVKMGDDASKGQMREVVGRLIDIRPSPKFPENPLYELQLDDGSMVAIAGTTAINNRLNSSHVGKRIRLTYLGEVSSSSGNVYRDIEVAVDDEDRQESQAGARADLPVHAPGVNNDGALNKNIPLPDGPPDDESFTGNLPF